MSVSWTRAMPFAAKALAGAIFDEVGWGELPGEEVASVILGCLLRVSVNINRVKS